MIKKHFARACGLISGALMIIVSVAFFKNGDLQAGIQLLIYGLYAAAIITAIFALRRGNGGATFKQYFSEGFKCFIIATLMMVVFMAIFLSVHPELKVNMMAAMRLELAADKTLAPLDIENRIASAEKAYFPAFIMLTVFRYLVIGVLVTGITGGILSAFKKQN